MYGVRVASPILISIHAPREGSDMGQPILCMMMKFLSTLPARGATWRHSIFYLGGYISIHAPREGSDGKCAEK